MNKDFQERRNKTRGFSLNLDAILYEVRDQIVKAIRREIQNWIDSSVMTNAQNLQEFVELIEDYPKIK